MHTRSARTTRVASLAAAAILARLAAERVVAARRSAIVHFSADTPAVDVLTQDGSATVVGTLRLSAVRRPR